MNTYSFHKKSFWLLVVCIFVMAKVCASDNNPNNLYHDNGTHKRFEVQYRNPNYSRSGLVLSNATMSVVGACAGVATKVMLQGYTSDTHFVSILACAGLYGAAYGYWLYKQPNSNSPLLCFLINEGNILGGMLMGYILR